MISQGNHPKSDQLLQTIFAHHDGETDAKNVLSVAQRRAHAKAAHLLAAASCPPDLIEWGHRHGIPTFAEVTWMDGFATGMRTAMQEAPDPEPRLTEQMIAEMEALQTQLRAVRVALCLTGLEGRPISSYVKDLVNRTVWRHIDTVPRDGTEVLLRAKPRGYERWIYGVGSLTQHGRDWGWSKPFPPTEWQPLQR